jgi:serine/threonine-protein kinase
VKRRPTTALLTILLGVAATAPHRAASAQTAEDKAAAERLFNDAMTLMDRQDYEGACARFAESLRLDAGIGVKLHLADCYEHLGRTASAWATFREAGEMATREGDEQRADVAKRHAAALEPVLSTLTITVAAPAPGLAIERDGVDVGHAQWGLAVPVDPGPHHVSASAPGTRRWETTTHVPGAHASVTLTVPALEPAGVAAPAAPQGGPTAGATRSTTPAAPDAGGTPDGATGAAGAAGAAPARLPPQRIAALAAGGAGVLGIGLGAFFGLQASSHLSDSNAGGNCVGDHCTPAGTEARNDALSAATASTIAFVAGGVALAAGAVLWFTTPRPAAPHVGLTGTTTGRTSSIVLVGSF